MANNPQQTKVTVVGLGLIGGSLAAALSQSGDWHVTGFDRNADSCSMALKRGIVAHCQSDFHSAIETADLIVLATPVQSILDYLDQLLDIAPKGSVIMDLGSTKRSITAKMAELPEDVEAIGGHPMAGKQTSGVDGASPDLYRDRKFVLVDNARTGARARKLGELVVNDIGATLVNMDAASHDRAVAMISHVPHFLSVPLLLATKAMDDEDTWRLIAGGYRWATAPAMDNPSMWQDIGLTNGDYVANALRSVAIEIERFATTLESGSEEEILSALTAAQDFFTQRFS